VHLLLRALVLAIRVPLPSVLSAVPPILHGIVGATFEPPCDLSPPLAHLGDQLLDQLALFRSNGLVVQRRLEVLVKAFPTLLWGSRSNFLGNPNPVVGSIAIDQLDQPPVFVLRPRATTMSDHDVFCTGCQR
jgi:hypothetical protein